MSVLKGEVPLPPLKDGAAAEAITFAEELPGWHGFVEWEKYPEKKARAASHLGRYAFQSPPEFQLVPLPNTNPILEGVRWKQYHAVMGPTLAPIPDISWDYVKKEKAKDMIHVLQFPYNGEPPRRRLVQTPVTRNEDFFVRNHGGIPEIEFDAYKLDIHGLVKNPRTFTMKELMDESVFPRQSAMSELTHRRYPGDGDELINAPWGEGAIGNARWIGVSLKKVIKACGGLKTGARHLEFIGADTYFKKGQVYNYAVSVPWRKVKLNEVLLAWEMNGEPLPRIHGYPLRVVVFGYIGARSCKWLYQINAIPEPSEGPVQKKEYLYYSQQIGKHNTAYSNGFSIQDMPVSSAIMTPVDKEVIVHEGKIRISGWAYSGGGRWVERVEVSGDGGSVWYEVPYENMSEKYFYAWRTWWIDLPVDAEGWLELCARCWDNALNTQPTFVRSAWNFDLHVTSSCHRVSVYSANKTRPSTRRRLEALGKAGTPLDPITKPVPFDIEDDDHYATEMKKRGGRDPEE